jgi:glycosyltransferase involved in cell wall biosynthesis
VRICIFSIMGGGPWGASEELWAATAHAALDEGHAVAIVSKRCPAIPKPIAALRARGAEAFWRKHDQSRRIDRQIDRRIHPLPAVARWRPDVVLVNLGTFYALAYRNDGEHWMKRLGVPYVIVSHHNHDVEGAITEPYVYHSHVDFYRQASLVAFVAEANRQAAYRQLATPLPNSCVVRTQVNLRSWDVVPWPRPSEPVHMACVGRLDVSYKGQDILLEVLAGPAWRDRPWRVRFYGGGDDRSYLEDLAGYLGIADRVDYPGFVADMRALWAENHLLVVPSRSEGTPASLVEAQICGRPAVVTDVGGNAEWVEEPDNGFVAEASTVRSFGAAMERAWAARSRWEEMGLAAHREAVARADPEPGRSLLKLLTEAAGRVPMAGALA